MDSLDDRYFSVNRVLLSSIGLWPYDRTWLAYAKRVAYLLLILSMMMFQIRTLFLYSAVDSGVVLDALTNTIFCVTVLWIYILYLRNLRGVRQLMKLILEDWKKVKNEIEMRLLLKSADTGKFIILLLTVSCSFYYLPLQMRDVRYYKQLESILHDLYEYFKPGLHVLFVIYVVMSIVPIISSVSTNQEDGENRGIKTDEKYFVISLINTYVGFLLGLICFIGAESTTILCVYHGFGMYDLLGFRIVNCFNADETNGTTAKKHCTVLKKLRNIAILHKRTIQFYNLLDKKLLTGYFFIIILSVASLSLALLRFAYAVLRFRDLSRICGFSSVIIGVVFSLAVMSHMGQITMDCSTQFFSATYTGMWYTATVPDGHVLSGVLSLIVACTTAYINFL